VPTVEDLGQKVKAKYPGQYDDFSNAELGERVKAKYPDAYKDFSDRSVSTRAKENLDPTSPKARKNEAIIQTAAQDEKNLYGRFAKDAALAAAAGLTAPFTAGASIPAAMAIAGGAGLAGGTAGELFKSIIGSSEVPKTAGGLAKTLGFDTAAFAGGEGFGRLIGVVGKTLLPKLVVQTAAQATKGKQLLQQAYSETSEKLYGAIDEAASRLADSPTAAKTATRSIVLRQDGPPIMGYLEGKVVPNTAAGPTTGSWYTYVDKPLKNFYDRLEKLPRMSGKFGQRFGGLTPKASEVVADLESQLRVVNGAITEQPLPGVIRAQHSLQKAAYEDTGLATEEAHIFRKAAAELGDIIKGELKDVGPAAQALYKQANDLVKTEMVNNAAVNLTRKGVASLARKMFSPAVGFSAGYVGSGGNLKSALAGAAVGAALPEVSYFILKQTLAHPKAGPLMRKAADLALDGKSGPAGVLAARAMVMAGARQTLKSAGDQTQPEPVQAQPAP
jgi:hypothetical protein